MANGGNINYTIGFNVDKSGLKDLENTLKDLNKMSATNIMKDNPGMSMNEAKSALLGLRQSVTEVQNAYSKAFDSKTGILNIEKMQSSLKKLDLNTIQKNFAAVGSKGSETFLKISQSALTANVRFKETNSLINKMGTTLINTLKWTFSSSLINRFTGSIQQAVGYVEHLDRSLNDIRIVTKKSTDEMEQFGQQANKAAQALSKATTDYTEAALIYYQQGLSDEEVKARAETTLKAANVTGQATKTVSEQLTAVWNGFRVNAEQTEDYVDKLAAVAAISASNLEELSTGMSKVASAAANLGVDIDQLSAQISTIVSVTRQAPESVGTALKTIYARISDLKLGESDEDGLGLGDVSGGLKKLGIEVLDSEGELRDLGTVIEEVAGKWNTWTSAQQAAIAQLMAGKRQYNNLVALFSNWDMYENAINTSRNATGELQKQQDIYMESTEAHIQQLKTQWEDLYDSVLDEDAIIGVTDALNGILTVITKIIDAVGGGSTLITGLLGTIINKFAPQITQQVIMPLIKNFQAKKYNDLIAGQLEANTRYAASQNGFGHEATQEMLKYSTEISKVWSSMTTEQKNESQEIIKQIGHWKEVQTGVEKTAAATTKYLKNLQGLNIKNLDKGVFNLSDADQKKALEALTDQKTKVDDIKKSYLDLQKIGKKITKDNSGNSILDPKDLDKADKLISGIKDKLKDLKRQGLISEDVYKRDEANLNKLFDRIDKIRTGKVTPKDTIFRESDVKVLQGLVDHLGIADSELQNYIQLMKEGKLTAEQAAEMQKKLADALDISGKKAAQRTQDILQTIGAISQLASGIQSFTNVMQTMGDSSVEDGEKVKNFFMSLIYMIPMFATAIVTLSKTLTISAPVIAGIAIAITAVAGAISLVSSIGSSARKEAAENAKNLADASTEVAQAAREEKKAVDELKTSYDALDKTSVTYRDDLRKLLIDHGEFAKAAQVATSSLEELDEMMKQIQEDANNKVIDSSTEQIERLKNAISTDINANVLSGSERDFENGVETIDLGDSSDTASIAQILQDNGIDIVTDSGHINLQQFVNAMVENEAELRKALQENGSAAARRLLEIMGSEQEMLSTTAEALTAKQEAQLSNIENNIDIKSNGTFEEYDKAFTELKQKANEIFKDDKKAEEWAKKRIAESGAVGTAYAGLTDEVKGIVKGLNKELTVEQLNYLNDHVDIYKAYGKKDAQAFLDGAQAIIDGQAKSGLLVPITLSLSKDEFKDEDITALFSNGPLGDLTEGEFRLFDTQKQKRELRKYFNELAVEQETYNKETIKNHIENLNQQKEVQEQQYQSLLKIGEKYNIDKNSLDVIANQDFIKGIKDQQNRITDIIDKNNQRIEDRKKGIYDDDSSISSIEQQNEALTKQYELYNLKLKASQEIKELLKDSDKNAQEIVDQYEATVKEIDKEIASIAAHSKELAASVQDIEDLEKLHKAGEITDTDYSERYMQLDRAQDIEGLDVEQLENYTKYIQEIAKSSDELADSLEEDGDAADKVAKSIMKMNKGIEELSSNFENWSDMLQHSNKDSQEYLDALSGMRKAISQLLDISEDYVSSNFLNENLELIGKAAEGDAEAIDSLRTALAKDVVMNLKLNDESFRDDLLSKVQSWQAELDSRNLEVGATFDDASMIAAMNKMIADVGLTVDQVNALFDSMGFEANFAAQKETIPGYTTLTTKHHEVKEKNVDENGVGTWVETEWIEQEPIKSETGVPAFALTTDGSAPKINSITKKATGSMNNASGRNAGGTKKSSSSGGSSSAKQPNKENPLEREEDIYREINTELKNIESTLKRIQTIDEHSWGESQKKALKEEQKLLDKQIATLERKQKMQVGDLSTRRKQLENEGVKFSEDGSVMTNAEQVLNDLYAGYNAMVAKYNSMSAAEQEAYKAQMETEKNRIDAIEKKINEYESGYSNLQSTLDSIQNTYYQQIEANIKEFNHDIELHLELSDAQKEWDKFWSEVVEDVADNDFGGKIAASFRQLSTLLGENGDVSQLTNHLFSTISEVYKQIDSKGADSIFGSDSNASKEALLDYISKVMSAVREAKQNIDDMSQSYLDELHSEQEAIDKQIEGWEAIGKHLNHNLEMVKLLYGENAYEDMNYQYEQIYKNNLNLIETEKMSKDLWAGKVQYYKDLLESTDKATDPENWERYSKSLEECTANYLKATEDLDSAVEETVKTLQEQKKAQIDETFDELEKSLTDGLGFDALEEEWQLINEYADRYYDNVERYLNMEEYTQELNKAASAIGLSAENQQKLNDFRDQELKQLQEKEDLTEYDIEESRARLEIMKAQMALEDAQRNKSNMRLRRDSQGNYTYQYTADQDAIDEAEGAALNAKKSWYELVKKRSKETIEVQMDLVKKYYEFEKKWQEAKDAGDTELAEHYLKLRDKTEQEIRKWSKETAKVQQDLFSGTAQYFANVEDAEILKHSEATVAQLVDVWANNEDSYAGAMTKATDKLIELQGDYEKKVQETLDTAGTNMDAYRTGSVDPTTKSLEDLVGTNEDLKETLDDVNDSLEEHDKLIRDAVNEYYALRDAAVDAISAAEQALKDLSQAAIEYKNNINEAIRAAQSAPGISYDKSTYNPSSSGDGSSGGDAGTDSQSPKTDNTPYEITIADKASGHTKRYSTFKKSDIYNVMAPYATGDYVEMWVIKGTNRADLTGNITQDELKKKVDAIRFDTGGYTGSWPNDNGRLAVLHQKELVLNSSDTENLLSAIEILRALPFSALAKSIVDSSSSIAASFGSGINVSGVDNGSINNDTKNMTINADFSGVSSADEIYQALIELENYGMQQSYSVAPNINNSY